MRGIWDILYTRPNHKCPFVNKSKDEEFVKFVKGETPPGVSKKLSFDLVVNGNLRYVCVLSKYLAPMDDLRLFNSLIILPFDIVIL